MDSLFYHPGPDCQIDNLSQIYLTMFGKMADGVFLEIGAFDGESVSNTCFLADLGWRGYYCEPVPEYALRCQARHVGNNVKVFTCAVGEKPGMIEISVANMISTTRMDHVEVFNHATWSHGHHNGDIRRVPCLHINELIKIIGIKRCDLAVIDVEGLEPSILNNWDFELLKPRVLIVETRDRDPEFPEVIRQEYSRALKRLRECGYYEVQHDGCNVILAQVEAKAVTKAETVIF